MIVVLQPINYKIPIEEIEMKEILGKGSFGKTYKAIWKGKSIACKVLDFSFNEEKDEDDIEFLKQQIQSFLNEVKIYKELCSQHIIRYLGESISGNNDIGKKIICLELMESGTVYDVLFINKIDLSLRKRFNLCLDLISGLRRIHSKGIVHKDLKPDNIFVDKDLNLKIGDLGLAYNKKIARDLKELKQEYYYPPQEESSKYGDIYSTGLIINEIFTGIRHNKKNLYEVDPKSNYFFDVIDRCLSKDIEKRPLAEQIEDHFLNFEGFFWNFIQKNKVVYTKNMGNKEKNDVFKRIYNEFIKEFGDF